MTAPCIVCKSNPRQDNDAMCPLCREGQTIWLNTISAFLSARHGGVCVRPMYAGEGCRCPELGTNGSDGSPACAGE